MRSPTCAVSSSKRTQSIASTALRTYGNDLQGCKVLLTFRTGCLVGGRHLAELVSLNLSNNSITTIENLAALTKLETLMLSNNRLETVDDVRHLAECPAIACLDLKSNSIDDPDVSPTALDLGVRFPPPLTDAHFLIYPGD